MDGLGRQLARYWFVISLFLIGVVYFAGLSTDAKVFGDVINNLGKTFTGRNANGEYAQYPNQPHV